MDKNILVDLAAWEQLQARAAALRAENERLKSEREHLIEAAHQLQAENERLGRDLQRCQEAPYG